MITSAILVGLSCWFVGAVYVSPNPDIAMCRDYIRWFYIDNWSTTSDYEELYQLAHELSDYLYPVVVSSSAYVYPFVVSSSNYIWPYIGPYSDYLLTFTGSFIYYVSFF